MAFKYRNAKTGEVISTTNRVSGKNWVPVEDPPAVPPVDPPAAPPKEKSAKKGKQ